MKFRMTLVLVAGIFCLSLNNVLSQCDVQRPLVNDLTPAKQCELRNLMLDYLQSEISQGQTGIAKYPIVADHTNPNFSQFHNYAEEFATWHRNYVQGMEEYFISLGKTEFVPLPYWKPTEIIPDAFFNYAGCSGTYANLPESEGFPQYTNGQGPFPYCDLNSNGVQDPTDAVIDFSEFDENFDCNDWNDVDEFVGNMEGINWPTNGNHDAVHCAVGGTLGPPSTAPASTLFWLFHAYITDLHSCYKIECDGENSDLYVRDNGADDGTEPTNDPSVLWVSPDIWVRNDNDGFSNHTSEGLCFKQNAQGQVKPVYIYVRTWNQGTVPSKNGEGEVSVYWAQASAGLSWPAPWDGSPNPSVCNLPLGGFIGSQTLRTVNGTYFDAFDVDRDGNSNETIIGYTIYEFEWLPPNPDPYINCFNDEEWHHRHFCIHARVDDGTPLNLTGNFYQDLILNNDLALKNIAIYGPDDGNEVCDDIEWLIAPPGGKDCLFFGNYTDRVMNNVKLEIAFPTPDDKMLLNEHDVTISLEGAAMQRWIEGGSQGNGIMATDSDSELKFLTDHAYIEGIMLQPMEVHRFCIEVVGDPILTSAGEMPEFDIVQYGDDAIVGGERYVIRNPTSPAEPRSSKMSGNSTSGIQVYPNPTNGQFTVDLNGWKEVHNIQIVNSVGQVVQTYTQVVGRKTMSATGLAKGIYTIRIENRSSGTIVNKKLIVE